MKNKKSYIIGLFVVNLLLFNVFSESSFFRLDFTADKRYTVSPATQQILENLQQPVTITGYFSKNLPVQFQKPIQDFKDLVIEYHHLSGAKIMYRFTEPQEDDQDFVQAQQNGLQPVSINVEEKDQVKQQLSYMGVVVQRGNQKEIIPFIQPNANMEYDLTSTIKKVSLTNKKSIAFLQGHGQPTVDDFRQAMPDLSTLYNLVPVTLNDTIPVLETYPTVVIVGPKQRLERWELNQIEQYLQNGGNLVLALNSAQVDLQTLAASDASTGLEQFLVTEGIRIESQLIVDVNCSMVSVTQEQNGFQFRSQVKFPFIPVFGQFAQHSITEGLEAVAMQFANPITFAGDSNLRFTPLVFSSQQSGTVNLPTDVNPQRNWTPADFAESGIVAAAAIEGKITAAQKDCKIVLFADADFATPSQQQQPDNTALFINSIDWLTDASGLMQLRAKQVSSRPISVLDDNTKAWLKWANFVAPILLLMIYGMVRFQRNRVIRKKRMEEDYV